MPMISGTWVCFQIKQSVSVPVVANGDIKSEADVRTVYEKTAVNGNYFMSFYLRVFNFCYNNWLQ